MATVLDRPDWPTFLRRFAAEVRGDANVVAAWTLAPACWGQDHGPNGIDLGAFRIDLSEVFKPGPKPGTSAFDFPANALAYWGSADAAALDITPAITVEAWVYHDALAGEQGHVTRWNSTAGKRAFLLRKDATTDRLTFGVSQDGAGSPNVAVATSAAALAAATWYRVAGTFDGTTAKAFINGVQDGSGTGASAIFTTDIGVDVGRFGNAASPMNGRIAAVVISNVARATMFLERFA